jgi:Na+-transporting methylmalonyl-CoA/oxaloacetate decarboxylase gamma subunit
MKKFLSIPFMLLIPLLMQATGIPEENRSMIFTITVVGIVIVLIALTVVTVFVAIMSKTIHTVDNRDSRKVKKIKDAIMSDDDDKAIAIAVALHLEQVSRQQEEKAILTLQKVIKPFSGWNNKALGMRMNPRIR